MYGTSKSTLKWCNSWSYWSQAVRAHLFWKKTTERLNPRDCWSVKVLKISAGICSKSKLNFVHFGVISCDFLNRKLFVLDITSVLEIIVSKSSNFYAGILINFLGKIIKVSCCIFRSWLLSRFLRSWTGNHDLNYSQYYSTFVRLWWSYRKYIFAFTM